jgi:hypothetical protein
MNYHIVRQRACIRKIAAVSGTAARGASNVTQLEPAEGN